MTDPSHATEIGSPRPEQLTLSDEFLFWGGRAPLVGRAVLYSRLKPALVKTGFDGRAALQRRVNRS